MPISIQRLAKKANVSISTVLPVLNRRSFANEDARKCAESAINDLEYSPNVFARELGYKLMISTAVAKDDGSELMAAVADHGIKRLSAFRNVTAEFGREVDPGDVHHLDYQYDTAFELAAASVNDWAGSGAAVFAANEEMAAGIIDAALAARLSVRDDVAVVGVDDTRVVSMTRSASSSRTRSVRRRN